MTEPEATTNVQTDAITFWSYLSGLTTLVLCIISVLAFIFTLSPFRLLPDLFLLVSAIVWFRRPHIRRARVAAMFLAAFLLMEFYLPFDVSILYRPGRPRVLPLVMGLPRKETVQQAQRGELALGGCIVMGNEPRWILVW